MDLIAGDIGGTKTTLALYSSGAGQKDPVAEATFACRDYLSLEDILREFMDKAGTRDVRHACFGVAGPVIGDRAVITNLPWTVDRLTLMKDLGFSEVRIINDLEAMAEGIALLDQEDFCVLNRGLPVIGGTRAVIAPGTGLGQAYLTWDGSRYVAHASEGGHADFGPVDAVQIDLLKHLMALRGHVSYETICSGSGLPNIYSFLKDQGLYREPGWFAEMLSREPDRTAVIIRTALDPEARCEICTATLDLFVAILGAEAGNLALKHLSRGGVFLGGGIPPRILPLLKTGRFMEAFTRKGRLSRVMEGIPVSVILNQRAGLFGAAAAGFRSTPPGE